jgi:alanine racemase
MDGTFRPPEEAGARLIVDLGAIAANWRQLADLAAPGECAAVVKADAYGLGAAQVAPALWDAGARTFFVAQLAEARVLRPLLPDAVIYVLNGLRPGATAIFAELRARPVLGSLPEIEEWQAAGCGEVAIHVDTGMNRLGITLEEAFRVAERYSAGTLGFQPSLIMSHLACADEEAHPLTARQIADFRKIVAAFGDVPASLANSSATIANPDARFDLCRPGIAVYGGNPVPWRDNPVRPVVRLEGRVVQVRDVPEGQGVGYGAAEVTKRPSRIAIVSVGYADGFLRAGGSSSLRTGAETIVRGQRCPLIGRISMDLLAVDVTEMPVGSVSRGDFACLLGDGITVDEVAGHAGTISYEMLTGLGARYARTYTI